jgi:hypothetical protein
MVSPSGRVPERALDWFFVATEACGGGTPDLGSILEALGFTGSVGVGDKSRGPTRRRQGWGGALGGGPSTLVVASGLFSEIFSFQYFLYFPKIFSVDFQVNWIPFDIPFLRSSKTRKKQKLALGSRLIG